MKSGLKQDALSPRECRYYKSGVCDRSKRCYRPCILKCGVHCSDFTLKNKKDE